MCSEVIENKILKTLELEGRPVEFKTLLASTGLADARDLFETVVSELVLRRHVILTKDLKLVSRRVKSARFRTTGGRGREER